MITKKDENYFKKIDKKVKRLHIQRKRCEDYIIFTQERIDKINKKIFELLVP